MGAKTARNIGLRWDQSARKKKIKQIPLFCNLSHIVIARPFFSPASHSACIKRCSLFMRAVISHYSSTSIAATVAVMPSTVPHSTVTFSAPKVQCQQQHRCYWSPTRAYQLPRQQVLVHLHLIVLAAMNRSPFCHFKRCKKLSTHDRKEKKIPRRRRENKDR